MRHTVPLAAPLGIILALTWPASGLLMALPPVSTDVASGPTSVSSAGPSSAIDLQRIAVKMRQIERRLALGDSGATTQQLQQQVIQVLDQRLRDSSQHSSSAAIDSRTPQASSASSPSQSPHDRPKESQEVRADSKESGHSPENSRAGNQGVGSTRGESSTGEEQKPQGTMDQAWGTLPAALRQQLRSHRPERFLPQYEKIIEQYFRRLGETSERSNAKPRSAR